MHKHRDITDILKKKYIIKRDLFTSEAKREAENIKLNNNKHLLKSNIEGYGGKTH
jgi:hypothetical protein